MRRDALAEADDAYWAALAIEVAENGGVSEATLKAETHRVQAAQARAMAFGFSYKPASVLSTEVADEDRLERLLKRIEEVQGSADASGIPKEEIAEALLGGAPEPKPPAVTVSMAFEIFLEKIAFSEIKNKSEKQRYSWEKTKKTDILSSGRVKTALDVKFLKHRSQHIVRLMEGQIPACTL